MERLFCTTQAPHGAIQCPGCGQVVPVFPEDEDGVIKVVPHPSGKAICLAGNKVVRKSWVKPATWIDM